MNNPIHSYTRQQVRAAREEIGHTQTEAAALIYRTMRSWQDWESGARNVDPAAFELYLIKTGQLEI
jgi:DNA (cytosine-5)-methyltransferase 1